LPHRTFAKKVDHFTLVIVDLGVLLEGLYISLLCYRTLYEFVVLQN